MTLTFREDFLDLITMDTLLTKEAFRVEVNIL